MTPRNDSPSRARPVLKHLLLLALFPILFEAPIILRYGLITEGDAELVQKIATVEHLRDGLPLVWTQLVDCGTAFFGSTNASISPWDILLFFLNPFCVANLAFTSYLIIGGIGFFLWRCRGCGSNPVGAFLGALVYEGSSYALVNTAIGHETLMQQYAWFPFALWSLDRLAHGNRLRFMIVFPWIIFGMSLSTYPLFTWIAGSIVFLRLLWLHHESGSPFPRRLADITCLGAATALGLGFFAFFFVPAGHFAAQAVAPGNPDFNLPDYKYHITLPPTHLLTLLNPYLFGGAGTFWSNFLSHTRIGGFNEYVLYCGLVPLAIVWNRRRYLGSISEGRFWFALVLLYTLISFGKWGGLYALLSKLPVIENFRGPARYTVIWPIGLALLTCLGFESRKPILEQAEACGRTLVRLTLLALLLAFLTWACASALLSCTPWERWIPAAAPPRLSHIVRSCILPGLANNLFVTGILAAGLLGIWYTGRKWRLASHRLLAVLLVFDLAWTGWVFCFRPSPSQMAYAKHYPLGEFLKQTCPPAEGRVMDIGYTLPKLRSLQDRFAQIDGYKPLHLPWYQEFINQLNGVPLNTFDTYDYRARNPRSPLLPFLRVRYIVSDGPQEIPQAQLEKTFGQIHIYRTSSVRPLFHMAAVCQVIPERSVRLRFVEEALAGGKLPMAVEAAPRGVPVGPAPSWGAENDLVSTADGALGYRIRLNRPHGPCLVGSPIAWYDAWCAFDQDGARLPVLRVNHAFLGIEAAAATREIVLGFDAVHHRLGLWISAAALTAYAFTVLIFYLIGHRTMGARRVSA